MSGQLTYEFIQRYLDNDLPADEMARVEQKIAEDPQFASEVEEIRMANDLILDGALFDEKTRLESLDYEKLDRKVKRKKRLPFFIIGVVGLGIGSLFLIPQEKITSPSTPTKDNAELVEQASEATDNTSNTADNHSTDLQVTVKDFPADLPTSNPQQATLDSNNLIAARDSLPQPGADSSSSQPSISPAANASTPAPEPCTDVNFIFETVIKEPCYGEDNGSIKIQLSKSSSTPTYYQLFDEARQQSGSFERLPMGEYVVNMSDADGCDTTTGYINLGEKFCPHYTYIFYPSADNEVEFDFTKVDAGTLTIVSRQGSPVSTINFEKDEVIAWNGTDKNGQPLSTGLYILIIKFASGQTEKGEVTISE